MDILIPIIKLIPRGNRELVDQLKRAGISLVLNIAEGAGKSTSSDKKRFYAIARGSALECAAILDLICRWEITKVDTVALGKDKLHQIASMLSKLILR